MTTNAIAYPEEKHRLLVEVPAVGVILFLVGGMLFSLLAFNVVTHGPLLALDGPVAQDLHQWARHDFWLDLDAMIFLGTLGRETAVILTVLLGLYWLWKRHWRELSLLLVGVVGGNCWFEVLSRFFGRPRPSFPDPLDHLTVPGFPSGHSLTAVLLYGLILYLLLPRLASRGWRILAMLDAVAITLLIGYSRLYMGDHFLTDVLAGYAFGLAWAGLVYTTLENYFGRYTRSRAAAVSSPLLRL